MYFINFNECKLGMTATTPHRSRASVLRLVIRLTVKISRCWSKSCPVRKKFQSYASQLSGMELICLSVSVSSLPLSWPLTETN
jgi:hypothetical protein